MFKDALHPVAQTMWDLLRSALLHYLRHDGFTEAERRNAKLNLLKYSALTQEVRKGHCVLRVLPPMATQLPLHVHAHTATAVRRPTSLVHALCLCSTHPPSGLLRELLHKCLPARLNACLIHPPSHRHPLPAPLPSTNPRLPAHQPATLSSMCTVHAGVHADIQLAHPELPPVRPGDCPRACVLRAGAVG